jgi:hypothetical protein
MENAIKGCPRATHARGLVETDSQQKAVASEQSAAADGRVPVRSVPDVIVLIRGEVKCESLSSDSCIVGGRVTVVSATSPATHSFPFIPFILFSCSSTQVKRVNRFPWLSTQTMRFPPRKSLFGSHKKKLSLRGQ